MRMTHRLAGLLAATLLVGAALAAGTKEEIEAHLRAGRWQQAEAELQQVLDKHPDNATAHYWLAQAQYRQGRTQEAAAEARRALALDPSQRFAADPQLLQTLLAAAAPRDAAAAPAPRPAEAGGSHLFGWLLALGLIAGAGLLWLATRSRERADQNAELELWRGKVRQAIEDLKDAVKASDADPSHSPEVKLANYDRSNQLQSALQTHLADLPRRTDYRETQELIARAHDVAAQIRGEEPPSVRQERLERERLAQQAAAQPVMMAPGYTGYGPVPSAGGPGVLGTVAAVGVGAAGGLLLAEAAEAATHSSVPQAGYDAGPGLDLGGATGSAADWSAGGGSAGDLDLGSGGGDDFS